MDLSGSQPLCPCRDVTWTWPWERHAGGYGMTTSEIYWVQIRLARNPLKRPEHCPPLHASLEFEANEGHRLLQALQSVPEGRVRAHSIIPVLMPRLVKRIQENDGLIDLWVKNQTRQLLIELAERCFEEKPHPEEAPALERVRTLLSSLPESLGEPWTLDEMAEACDLGRSQFARHFAELRGETPMRHLNRLRIKAASKKLKETEDTITDIAFDSGFGSSQHFARVFKQFSKYSPREYRTLNKTYE